MIICYTVPEIWRVTDVTVIFHFGLVFALLPPNSPKKSKFKKMKKRPGDIIILHIVPEIWCTTDRRTDEKSDI